MAYWGRPWFRQRRFGLGATPTTWQGWALMAAFLVLLAGVLAAPVSPDTKAQAGALLTGLLLVIAWAKTEGGWRWRWGGRE